MSKALQQENRKLIGLLTKLRNQINDEIELPDDYVDPDFEDEEDDDEEEDD